MDTFRTFINFLVEGDFSYEDFWRKKHGGPGAIKMFAAESTQGLLLYYYHYYLQHYKVLPREVYNYQSKEPAPAGIKVVHFTECGKRVHETTWQVCPTFRR